MEKLLKDKIINIKNDLENEKIEIYKTFLTYKKKNTATELLAWYKKEKEVLKKYNCANSSEILDYLTKVESVLRDLFYILR